MIRPWASVSGPGALMRAFQRYPDHLIPFTYLIGADGTTTNVPIGGRGLLSTVVAGTAITQILDLESDGDFWVLGASMPIHMAGAGLRAGFGRFFAHSVGSWWATCDPREESGGSSLSDQPVSVGAIFGDGGDRPNLFPCPWVLRAGTRVRMRIVSNSGAAGPGNADTRVWPLLHGFKRLGSGPDLPIDYFLEPRLLECFRALRIDSALGRVEPIFYSLLYGFNPDDAAPGQLDVQMLTQQQTITAADGDVFLLNLYGQVFNDLGIPGNIGTSVSAAAIAGCGAHISDGHVIRVTLDEGTRRLDDRPVPLRSLSGNGARWGKYPKPIHVRTGQTLTATVTPQARPTDGTSSRGWKIMLTFAGVKVYPSRDRA